MILSLIRKDPKADACRALYATTLSQAREPYFYLDLGVADTAEGRFEMLAVHVYMILRRLKQSDDGNAAPLAQGVTDAFFANLDQGLREMGIGDLSVAKKIRMLAEDFYGRVSAYENAMARESAPDALERAIARNVYGQHKDARASVLAAYMRAAAQSLAEQPTRRLITGTVSFPPTPPAHESSASL